MPLRDARRLAADAGLNVQAVLDLDRLAAHIPRIAPLTAAWPTLLLLGSTGQELWASVQARPASPDPVDTFVAEVLDQLRARIRPATRLLWPDPSPSAAFPISTAARQAGWGHRSRMGLTIHPRHGLWVACRAAILVSDPIPEDLEPPAPSPCTTCADAPCVSACPIDAVGGPTGVDLVPCFTERLRPEAACGAACAARLSCPVGATFRYSDAQIAHHQRFANHAFGPAVLTQVAPLAAWTHE